jgi:hypothetical protein
MYRESFLNVNPWPRALSRARVGLMYPRKVSRWNMLPGFYSEWPCWLAFSSFDVGRAFLRVARI